MSADKSTQTTNRSLSHCVGAAARVAFIGSTCLALIECAGAVVVTSHRLPGHVWPRDLIVAGLGKIFLTHAVLWLPILLAFSGAYWICVRRRKPRRAEPAMAAAFIVGPLLVTSLGALDAGGWLSRATVVAASVGLPLMGVAKYLGMRFIVRRLRDRHFRWLLNGVTAFAVVIAGVGTVALVRSPLRGPASYRVRGASVVERNDASRPHVLWIVLDTVRADRMSCYGWPGGTTPFLDAWAEQSLVFDRTVSNGIWTVPSHASMFTGRSIREHGMDHTHLWLDDALPTVADQLKAHGYATACFSNNPWISREFNLATGFDTAQVTHYIPRLSRFSLEHIQNQWGITPRLPWLDPDSAAAITNHLAAQWLDAHADGEAPVCLFVNFMDAHLPYLVPKRYRQMYMTAEQVDRSYDLTWSVYGYITPQLSLRFNIEGPDFFPQSDREVLQRQYEASVRYLDDRVRELVEMFERRGLLENTIVVIASDHGEYLDTHGMWDHRYLTYDDVSHVALLVREPGRTEGVRVTTPVQLSDLYPTILTAALGRVPAPAGHGAHDLVALAAEAPPSRVAVTEYNGPTPTRISKERQGATPAGNHRDVPQIAIQDGQFKYIASADGRRELYDLQSDPGELNNLLPAQNSEAERLAQALQTWLDEVPTSETARGQTPTMNPAVLEALRHLGYVEPEK
ncbi:MAG: sulfatase-like hydrolase/transferase [Phycisphaerae bacterium]|nr:sulfatase-like hydrolase/transferase [Phycisphaerae bacterium]